MSSSFKFAGACLVISSGLATLELISFVGISSLIALPFSLFMDPTDTYFYTIAWILGIAVAGAGTWCLSNKKILTGASLLVSITIAVAMGWVMVTSTAFEVVPTLQ